MFNGPKYIGSDGFRFSYDRVWIDLIGAHYKLGIDGISMLLVLLTTLLGFLAILSSWKAITERVKEYYAFHASSANRHDWRFYFFGFPPFLCFLGSHAGSHVFPDRGLGRSEKTLCCHQVLSLHADRVCPHAGRNPGDLFLPARCNGSLFLRYPQLSEAGLSHRFAVLGFSGIFCRLCHKGADVPVPHLVAGCSRGGAHGRICDSGGRSLKMGTYGFVRFSLPMFPRATMHFLQPMLVLCLIGIIYGALVAMMQKDMKVSGGLFFGQSPGICHVGSLCSYPRCLAGKRSANDQPRNFDGCTLLDCRC